MLAFPAGGKDGTFLDRNFSHGLLREKSLGVESSTVVYNIHYFWVLKYSAASEIFV
jgi:hypothetical protein